VRFTTRIMALPVLTAVTFAVMFAIGFSNFRTTNQLVSRLQSEFFTAVNLSHGLETEAMRIRHGLDTAVSLSDAEMVEEIDRMADRFRELLEAGRQVPSVDPAQLAELTTTFERFLALARQVTLQLIAQDDVAVVDPQILVSAGNMNRDYEELRAQLDGLTSTQVMNMRTAMTDAREHMANRMHQSMIFVGVAVLILVFMAATAILSIVHPLRKLSQAAGAIAQGDLDQEIDYRSRDDLGQLADSFRNMQHALEADIARREEAELALRESEERLALALDAANDGIWDVDVPTGAFYCSDRFAAILGYSPEEKPVTMAEVNTKMEGVDMEAVDRMFNQKHREGKDSFFEARLKRRDGSHAWVQIKGRTVEWTDDQQPRRMVGTISDISARRAAEKELEQARERIIRSEKMASLGRLVAGLAHELNSPLGALVSGSDLTSRSASLVRDGLPHEQTEDPRLQRALNALDQSSRSTAVATARLQELLGGLKRFTSLDRADLQEADLHELLDTTITVMCDANWEDVRLERHYGEIPRILCYPSQLNQLFLSLIQNAVQAMAGRGLLVVSTTVIRPGWVTVSIADTGRGIPAEDLTGLFEPGFRTDSDRVHLGWGLVTAARIAQDHGGHIKVDSEVGQGSTFTVELPVRPDRADA